MNENPWDGRDEMRPSGSVDPCVALARASVESYVADRIVIDVPDWAPAELLNQRAGVFVSLHERGMLRGCIGTIEAAQENLACEIVRNGVLAASQDPRFAPVRSDDLPFLSYSVDVLGAPELVSSLDELDAHRFGVIVSKGARRGLLLPDLEGVEDVVDQLSIAKRKAGIAPDETGVRIERFEVVRHTAGGEPTFR